MMVPPVSKRRFLGISAAATGLSVLPFGGASAEGQLATWRGTAMGALASMQIHHVDGTAAEHLIRVSVAEIRRLERMFSLYRDDSLLSVLNRRAVLEAPPAEFVELLEACRFHAELTEGAFDPTVQPLWTLYASHFAHENASPAGPSAEAIAAATAKIGWREMLVSRDRIALSRRGMALTLNGIAQGYVTDRIVSLLRSGGIDHSFVDLGEGRALGARPDQTPWQVGIADPDQPSRTAQTLGVVDAAVATSGAYGFRFDSLGRFNHLFDPKTGACAGRYRTVTAVMPTATAADALSTAFSLMSVQGIEAALRKLGSGEVYLETALRERLRVTARGGPERFG